MTDQMRSDGLRLLRVMNETQARGSEKAPVTPASAAQTSGLELDSDRYDEALRFLRDEGALVEGAFGGAAIGDYTHGGSPYRITQDHPAGLRDAGGGVRLSLVAQVRFPGPFALYLTAA